MSASLAATLAKQPNTGCASGVKVFEDYVDELVGML